MALDCATNAHLGCQALEECDYVVICELRKANDERLYFSFKTNNGRHDMIKGFHPGILQREKAVVQPSCV